MVLIDASNIEMGGGLELLKLLIRAIDDHNNEFKVILNPKVGISGISQNKIIHKKIGLFNRKIFYKKTLKKYSFSSILCFGNFPPPIKITGATTYTYLHNPFLIERSITNRSLKTKLYIFMTSLYLDLLKNNTEYFILQTDLVKRIFLKHYNVPESKCLLYPIYASEKLKMFLEKHQHNLLKKQQNFVYVSAYYDHKNHLNLLKAWEILQE